MLVEVAGELTFYFDNKNMVYTLSIIEEDGSNVEVIMNKEELEDLRDAIR